MREKISQIGRKTLEKETNRKYIQRIKRVETYEGKIRRQTRKRKSKECTKMKREEGRIRRGEKSMGSYRSS